MTLYAHNLPKHARDRLPRPSPMRTARAAADRTAAVPMATAAGWFRCVGELGCGAEFTAWTGKSGAEEHSTAFRHPLMRWVWATDEGAEVGA